METIFSNETLFLRYNFMYKIIKNNVTTEKGALETPLASECSDNTPAKSMVVGVLGVLNPLLTDDPDLQTDCGVHIEEAVAVCVMKEVSCGHAGSSIPRLLLHTRSSSFSAQLLIDLPYFRN